MLFPGNAKLGKHLIWSFSLPSGKAEVCVGMTPACKRVCYASRLEVYRPSAAKRYAMNLRLSRRRGFVRRIRAFLIANHVRVLRVHAGGEFLCGRPHKNSYVVFLVMWRKLYYLSDSHFSSHFDTT